MDAYTYQGDNYHYCVDCGTIINFGDMVFRGKWGYRCYTCQYYFDKREHMTNIKITAEVNGRQVPLETISTETFEAIKALEKPKEIPVARVGNYPGILDDKRLFLKVSDSLRNCITDRKNVKMVAIDLKDGMVTKSWIETQQIPHFNDGDPYENIKPL